MLNRRELALAAFALAAGPASAQVRDPTPPAAGSLRSGDFLWPKPPGSWVLYGPMRLEYAISPAGQAQVFERVAWEEQREAWLAGRSSDKTMQPSTLAVRDMDYEQFAETYYRAQQETLARPSVYVGHVAIVDVHPEDGPMVIEATPPVVRRMSYDRWLAEHAADLVFHGRVRSLEASAGGKVADIARTHLDKPYSFFNFNLLNERSFYCSKLAWCSVWKASGIALDGNADPRRPLWFSPKQMFYCDAIEHLNSLGSPGEYTPP